MNANTPDVELSPPQTLSSAIAADPPPADSRCQHRYQNGTRCRLRCSDSHSGLCSRHFRMKNAAVLPSFPDDSADLSAELLPELSECSSVVDLRKFLARLLVLVTQGRVSSRRASVLSYIAYQLLHSSALSKQRPSSNLKSSLLRLAHSAMEGNSQ